MDKHRGCRACGRLIPKLDLTERIRPGSLQAAGERRTTVEGSSACNPVSIFARMGAIDAGTLSMCVRCRDLSIMETERPPLTMANPVNGSVPIVGPLHPRNSHRD